MTSTLAQQLASISQAAATTPKHLRRGKASLVHDYATAADISVDDVHAAALQGGWGWGGTTVLHIIDTGHTTTAFEELRSVAPQLEAYHSSLLSRKALSFDRGTLNRTANEALDRQLHGCMAAMTDHFLHPAAFAFLELLIRVYKYVVLMWHCCSVIHFQPFP